MMNNDNLLSKGLTSKTLSGLQWTYLSFVGRITLSFCIIAVLARMLAPSHFGLFGMVLIFVGLAEMVGRHAIGPAIVQRIDLTDRHVDTGFLLILTIGAVLTAATWSLAPQIGRLFDEPMVPVLTRTASLVLIVNSAGVVPEHMLRRALQFKNLAVADILAEAVGYGLTALILASQGFGVWSLVWGMIMRRIVHVVVVLVFNPHSLKLSFSLQEAKALLQFGSGLALVGLFNFIAQRGSYFIIGRWLGAASLGYYTQASRLVSVPFEAVSLTLLNVLFPAMSARQQQIDRLQVVYLCAVELLSLLVIPASALVIVGAPEMVAIVLGSQWQAVVPTVQILAVALPFQICSGLNVPPVRALGGVYREALCQAVWALAIVVGVYFGIRWDLRGAAVSVVISWVLIQLLTVQLALSLLELDWRRFLRCYVPALWAGAWSGVAAWAMAQYVGALPLPAFGILFLEFLAWLVTLLAAMYIAPPFARPRFSAWVMTHLHFERLGPMGYCLRRGLRELLHAGTHQETQGESKCEGKWIPNE